MITPFIDFNIDQKSLLSFSCGPDSVCLAHLLRSEVSDADCITLLYFDHGLRPEEVKKDYAFIKSFSKAFGFRYHVMSLSVKSESEKHGISIEMAGRKLRYEALVSYALQHGISTVLTAHHKQDLAESVLLKLLRGARLLSTPIRARFVLKGDIICYRPLLSVLKSEMMTYLEENELSFCRDSSNQDIQFQRNRIRSLDPHFKAINSNYVTHLAAFSDYQKRVDDYFLEKVGGVSFSSCEDGFEIELSCFFDFLPLELEYALVTLLKQLNYDFYTVHSRHISSLAHLIVNKQPGRVSLSQDLVACVTQTRLVIKKGVSMASFYVEGVSLSEDVIISEINKKVIFSFVDSLGLDCKSTCDQAYLSLDHVSDRTCLIRSFESGDTFQPFGMDFSKKMSDYFIDNKIDRLERLRVPLFFIDNQLAWVGGYQVSEKFRITANTVTVLKIQIHDYD